MHSRLITATLTSALLITLAPAGCTRPGPASSAATPAAEPQPTASAAPAVAPDPAAAPTPVDPPSAPPPSTGPTRVAILNFGPPGYWLSDINDAVGIDITAEAWRQAADLLQRDGVQVVIVRVNSGGGVDQEIPKFHEVFRQVYAPQFFTVAWIESATSGAAMAVYPLKDIYFMPGAWYGACTPWICNLGGNNAPLFDLETLVTLMEDASRRAGRSPAIMRAMQVQTPLSASIDEKTGEVTWFGDTSGQYLVNRPGQIFGFSAEVAIKFKFAKGITADPDELVQLMGLHDVVWAGEAAAKFIDDAMRAADQVDRRFQLVQREFSIYFALLGKATTPADRRKFADKAIAKLDELRSLLAANPNIGRAYGFDEDSYTRDRDSLRRLAPETVLP